MSTIRQEFSGLREGTQTVALREVGTTFSQVFDGRGAVVRNGTRRPLEKGDILVVPSSTSRSL